LNYGVNGDGNEIEIEIKKENENENHMKINNEMRLMTVTDTVKTLMSHEAEHWMELKSNEKTKMEMQCNLM
jgi:hypothetical protein